MNQTTEAKDKTDRREIKFRVWHKQQKSILGNDWLLSANVTYEAIVKNPNVEVMQFTGLKDKNGKEIYEGDIIAWDFEYDADYDGDMPIVKRRKGKAAIRDIFDRHDIKWAATEGPGCEVIGNIYENQELLNHERI